MGVRETCHFTGAAMALLFVVRRCSGDGMGYAKCHRTNPRPFNGLKSNHFPEHFHEQTIFFPAAALTPWWFATG
jgi:hypothetical protein